jgi:predicted O-methyltransferase YrrM
MKDLFHGLRRLFGARTPRHEAPPDAATIAQWIDEIRAANLSYCGPPKLENLAEAGQLVRTAGVEGRWIEAGVALGGSAILMARMKPATTQLDLYDVYGMIPPPGNHDGEDAHRRYVEIRSGTSAGLGGDTYYGYVDNLLERVKQNLRRFQVDPEVGTVRCIPGLFEDTFHPSGPVAFAHLDCDWYDSVRVCIERLEGKLAPGGIVIFDDYSSYSGCRAAVDEWRARDRRLETVFERRSLGLRRTRS